MSIISRHPEEIQEQVILKTPAKTIFTCKCVCKPWCNLISRSASIKDRFKLKSPDKYLTSFIVVDKSSLYYVEYDFEKNDEQVCLKPKEELFDLSSLGYFNKENIIIVGSYNDLVCLTTKINDYLCGHVYICNLITQECTQLPSLVLNNKDYKDAGYGLMFYGFGYLPSTNEYKVVRISYKLDPSMMNAIYSGKIHVYTLGDSMGWRDRGITISQLYCPDKQGILVDGELYWTEGVKIAAFDLTEEKLYMLPRPPSSPSDWGGFKMVVLGGQLCFFKETAPKSSNIWLLKKGKRTNDSSQIWIKRSNVTMEGIYRYIPLTTAKNGDILFLHREKWDQPESSNAVVRYDPKTATSKELGDIGLPLPGYGKSVVHLNSYISLKSHGE